VKNRESQYEMPSKYFQLLRIPATMCIIFGALKNIKFVTGYGVVKSLDCQTTDSWLGPIS